MPVVYDEKSERNLGKIYRGTNTHWISPFSSENVRIEKYDEFLKWRYDILETIKPKQIFSGSSKICFINDENTVFKYIYDLQIFGNQIWKEILIYKKWAKKYFDLLPKIFNYGKFWMVEEKVKICSESQFYLMTKIPYKEWEFFICNMNMPKNSGKLPFNAFLKKEKRRLLKKYKNLDADSDLKRHIKYTNKIFENEILLKIMEFCYFSGILICDMHIENIGYKIENGKKVIKILDYGYDGKD